MYLATNLIYGWTASNFLISQPLYIISQSQWWSWNLHIWFTSSSLHFSTTATYNNGSQTVEWLKVYVSFDTHYIKQIKCSSKHIKVMFIRVLCNESNLGETQIASGLFLYIPWENIIKGYVAIRVYKSGRNRQIP